MPVTFLDVVRGLVYDEAQKAAFARDPSGYLGGFGFGDLDPVDVRDAVRLAVDNLPAGVARGLAAELEAGDDGHSLAVLAAVEPQLADLADPEALDDWHPVTAAEGNQSDEAPGGDETGAAGDGLPVWGAGEQPAGAPGDPLVDEGFGHGAVGVTEPTTEEVPAAGGDPGAPRPLDAASTEPAAPDSVAEPQPMGAEPESPDEAPVDPSPDAQDSVDPDELGL